MLSWIPAYDSRSEFILFDYRLNSSCSEFISENNIAMYLPQSAKGLESSALQGPITTEKQFNKVAEKDFIILGNINTKIVFR